MAIGSFVTYKHYKLEAEISSMTWKVSWNEVIAVPAQNMLRGSIHSRTGSQLVSILKHDNVVCARAKQLIKTLCSLSNTIFSRVIRVI